MSVLVSTAVWQYAAVGGSELLVMVAIADIAHDDGVAFISYKDLAHKIRLSERQSIRAVKRLVEKGQLEMIQQGGTVGDRRFANVYRVTPNGRAGDILSPGVAHVTPDSASASDTDDRGRVSPTSDQTSKERRDSLRESSEEEVPEWRRSASVRNVFDAWVSVADPPMKKMTGARERDTRKLLAATEDVNYAIRAIAGFVSSSKGADKSIGALLKTGPNTGSLASRIDYFAAKAPEVGAQTSRIPDGLGDIARHRLRAVLGEIEEAERLGDDDWLKRIADSMPSGFTAEKQDGRWVIVRSKWS